MPPALDTPEEVAVVIGGVVVILGAFVSGLGAVVGAAAVVWRRSVKPILASTQRAATTAATQLTPNHGSSVRDSLSRLEAAIRELHADIRLDREQTGRRLERLEARTPIQENTYP